MNSYILIVKMIYEICTHKAEKSMVDGVVTGDYTDILDLCDNIGTHIPFLSLRHHSALHALQLRADRHSAPLHRPIGALVL